MKLVVEKASGGGGFKAVGGLGCAASVVLLMVGFVAEKETKSASSIAIAGLVVAVVSLALFVIGRARD